MDKIILTGIEMYAFHGVYPEEKAGGQLFVMDLLCELNLGKVCVNDDIDCTVNYATLADMAQKVFTSERYNTIERAAQVVADSVLRNFPLVKTVTVTVKKPEAPIRGNVSCVAVEITRSR